MRRMILSGFPNRTDRIEAVGFSMPELVGILSEELGRTVIDKTGFKDSFDFTLNFVPDMAILGDIGVPPGNSAAPPSGGSSAPSIFEAMREQLGLGLRTARAPVEILVIDNVQTPSEN
jgi:uncharacterized protein (TIGR03435 family)